MAQHKDEINALVDQEFEPPIDQKTANPLPLKRLKDTKGRQDTCDWALAGRVKPGCGQKNVARQLASRFSHDRQVGHRRLVGKQCTDEVDDLRSFCRAERVEMNS